jgi:hypothetical protein
MKTYSIPADLLQKIVDHFQQQPWIVANNILAGINSVVTAVDIPPLPKTNGGDETDVRG